MSTINPEWIEHRLGDFGLASTKANKIASELTQNPFISQEVGVWKVCGTPVCKRILYIALRNKQLDVKIETGRLLKCLFYGLVVITAGIFGIISCFWQTPKDYLLGKKMTMLTKDSNNGRPIPFFRKLDSEPLKKIIISRGNDELAKDNTFLAHYEPLLHYSVLANKISHSPLQPNQFVITDLCKQYANNQAYEFYVYYNKSQNAINDISKLHRKVVTYENGCYGYSARTFGDFMRVLLK